MGGGLTFFFFDQLSLLTGVQSFDPDRQRRVAALPRAADYLGDYGYGYWHRKMVQHN